MVEQRISFEASRAIRNAVIALAYARAVPEPERRMLGTMLGRRPDEQAAEILRTIICRHRDLLIPELVAAALGAEVAVEAPAPPPAPAPMPEQATAKMRGRPPTGKALSGAERAKLWRQRHAVADVSVPQALAGRIRKTAASKGMHAADLVEAAMEALEAPAFPRVTRERPVISGVPVVFGLIELSRHTGEHPVTLERLLQGGDDIKERELRARVPQPYLPALARGEAVPLDESTCFDGAHLYKRITGPKGTAFFGIPIR